MSKKCNHVIGIVKDYDNESADYPWYFIYKNDKVSHDDAVYFDHCPKCGEKLMKRRK